ncbi:MAG: glutamate synthase subunit beta [Acidimicrobiales bacterium]|jgi:glutamate synthase (NADPH/NADH) small chain
MGDPRGFLRYERSGPTRRPIEVRVHDWREVYEPFPPSALETQAARCMDCGIPFCHEGCPLGNLIPEWNDLVMRGRMDDAVERLHATNNFPEFTGRLCPAPCEGSCVLGINAEPVLIKQVEVEIAEHARRSGGLAPRPPEIATGRSVAIVGSGPAGLAAAQQLTRAGHHVVVFERAEKIGGLLRYGIPEFKMEKSVLDQRLAQMATEGTEFRARVSVGSPAPGDPDGTSPPCEVPGAAAGDATVISAKTLLDQFDALVVAGGSTLPRDLPVPGRELAGIHFAMDYLKPGNLVCEGQLGASPISAAGKDVVIIGGGDTGADCLGTVHRQGARSVCQLEIMEAPPETRAPGNPWPVWPVIFRTSAAHEEGGSRLFAVATSAFSGDESGRVRSLTLQDVRQEIVDGRPTFTPVAGTEAELAADLVLLALGFAGPERHGIVAELGLELDARGNVAVGRGFGTSVERVFACGDMARGQSLIVWAIAEGRSAAAEVDRHLMGRTELGEPIGAGQLALS